MSDQNDTNIKSKVTNFIKDRSEKVKDFIDGSIEKGKGFIEEKKEKHKKENVDTIIEERFDILVDEENVIHGISHETTEIKVPHKDE